MNTDTIVYSIVYFFVSVIIAWIVFSLILMWTRFSLFNEDGSVNWWTTLWIVLLVVIFTWLVILVLMWIIGLFREDNRCSTCGQGTGSIVY